MKISVQILALQIGIIGGTGLDDPDLLQGREEKEVNTPFGKVRKLLSEFKTNNLSTVTPDECNRHMS